MMRHSRRRQQGSALLIVMLVMAMMGLIGFAALEAVTRDQRVAGFMKRKKIAFFAAEAGVSTALHALRVNARSDVYRLDGWRWVVVRAGPSDLRDGCEWRGCIEGSRTRCAPRLQHADGQQGGVTKFSLRILGGECKRGSRWGDHFADPNCEWCVRGELEQGGMRVSGVSTIALEWFAVRVAIEMGTLPIEEG